MRPHHLAMLAVPALLLAACAPVEKTNETSQASATSQTTASTVAPTTTVKPTDCQPVPAATIAAIEASRSAGFTTVTFSDWYWTSVPEKERSQIGTPKWPGVVIAAKVNGDSSTIALWGVGGLTAGGQPDGLVVPLNVTAWQVVELGKDVAKPGEGKGPLVEARDRVRSSKATNKAEDCAKAGKAS